MTTPQPPELPSITTDDLLKMIGDRDVTISRQASLINSQSIRIAELEEASASSVTKTSFDTADLSETAFNTRTTG
jgi:hypothetical protein